MRLIHLSDLHIGKRVNEFSMIEDQKYILTKIINIIDEEKPDGVIIAGDVYDKSIPGDEAVSLFNEFLTLLSKRKLQVFIISGNHDSAVKLSFASEIIDMSGIHFSPVYDGSVKVFNMVKNDTSVNIYMLPFIKPAIVRAIYKDEEINDYTDAVKVAIKHMNIDTDACNILVAHQFVTGASRSDSEEISVGGIDNVDASVFDAFDYVALGHIHGPQKISRDTIRYCGTPLKYSFSESKHHKSVTVLEIENKEIKIRTVELVPLRDMRMIKGTYEELTNKENYEKTAVEDYLHITLTDEEEVFEAMGKLRVIYPNLMGLKYENKRTSEKRILDIEQIEKKQPIELFEEFYETQNNQPMNDEQRAFMQELIEDIWREKA